MRTHNTSHAREDIKKTRVKQGELRVSQVCTRVTQRVKGFLDPFLNSQI